jgi:hypothetical protein
LKSIGELDTMKHLSCQAFFKHTENRNCYEGAGPIQFCGLLATNLCPIVPVFISSRKPNPLHIASFFSAKGGRHFIFSFDGLGESMHEQLKIKKLFVKLPFMKLGNIMTF